MYMYVSMNTAYGTNVLTQMITLNNPPYMYMKSSKFVNLYLTVIYLTLYLSSE